MNLTGNTILITGGTSGIGRALAERFHRRGNTVIVAGRRQALLDEVAAANPGIDGPGIEGVAVDVADPASLDALAAEVAARFPALNVLINNAGISQPEDLTAAPDPWASRAMLDTNVAGVLHLTARLLPTLMGRPRATIMATTSGLAFVPFARFPTYCASKAFLHSWLQSLRLQLGPAGVEVLELVPPYVQTELGGARQATDPHAVPLADYVAEVMAILERGEHPDGEILVERVRELREAERRGDYQATLRMNNDR